MKLKEFENLKIGDYVSPLRGKNKGKKCIVNYIWYTLDYYGKYNEVVIGANFIDPKLSNNMVDNGDIFINYRALKIEK